MNRNYVGWYKLKAEIEKRSVQEKFHQREVWWCSLGANIGFEEDGKNSQFYEICMQVGELFPVEKAIPVDKSTGSRVPGGNLYSNDSKHEHKSQVKKEKA